MAFTPIDPQKHNKKKRSSIPKAKAKAAATIVDTNRVSSVNMNEQFLINRGGSGGAVLQIRTPNPNDVLSGRGGSVNAHPGNIQFREWVSERRVDYNLAHSKNDKADICREIIARVVALGGRFLGRDNPSSPFWVELDDERIMAKTSQALREGAPRIRQEHRDVASPTVSSSTTTNKTKRRRSSAVRGVAKPEADGESTTEPQQQQQQRDDEQREQKRVRLDYNGHVVRPNQASPPLGAQPSPNQLLSAMEDHTDRDIEVLPPVMFPPRRVDDKVHRENSLACSDISGFSECFSDLAEPFVDPFENETTDFLLYQNSYLHDAPEPRHSDPPLLSLITPRNLPSPPPRIGLTRDTSNNHSNSSSSDNGGLGALMQQQQQQQPLNHLNGGSDSSSLHKFLADINNNTNNNHGVRPSFSNHQLHTQRPSLKRRSSSASNLSSRSSVSSVLSDLPDAHRKAPPPADFVQGMSMIHDALHPWKDEFNNNSNNIINHQPGRGRSEKHHHARLMGGSIRRRTTSSSQ